MKGHRPGQADYNK